MIPDELHEWKDWADRLNVLSLSDKNDFRGAAMALSDEVVRELGEFYKRAADEGHLQLMNNWFASNAGIVPMDEDERRVRNLIYIFQHIASAWGWPPFTSHRFQNLFRPTPDWSTVPEDLRALGLAAELCSKFTYVFSEEVREQLPNRVTPEERTILAQAAEQIRTVGYDRVKAWWMQRGTRENVEPSLVFNMIGVLDALDLPYYEKA